MVNQQRNPIKSVFKFFLFVGIFALLAMAALYGFSMFSGSTEPTCFVILGVDEDGSRTDTVMAGVFNPDNSRFDIISIPRDTRVYMPEARQNELRDKGRFVPASGYMKINQVHHYAGAELGVEYAVAAVSELLGVDIKYYVKIDTEAFRYIVDEIGGVEFDVPQRMIYDDPEQGLHINLQPGLQLLNGEQAEGLVRYRHGNYGSKDETPAYAMADLDRVKVQQSFITAMAAQLVSGNIVSKMTTLATACYKYVETNFNVADIPKYVKYAGNFNPSNINTYTLPCTSMRIDKQDYVIVNEEETAELIRQIFNHNAETIQILNGGYTQGLAAAKKEYLESLGYNVVSIGDYTGEKTSYTRIASEKKETAMKLQKLFSGSKTYVDKTLTESYNIVIILGTDEK